MPPITALVSATILLLCTAVILFGVACITSGSDRQRSCGTAFFSLALSTTSASVLSLFWERSGISTLPLFVLLQCSALGLAFCGEYHMRRSRGLPGFVNRLPSDPR